MSNNVLTAKEVYELAKWVEEYRDEIERDYRTYEFWAKLAEEKLHFNVTEANFSTACKTVGLVWKAKEKQPEDDVRFLAKMFQGFLVGKVWGPNDPDLERLRNLSHARQVTIDKTLFDKGE